MIAIGEKISELRKQKGITQEQLAEIIGVSSQSVSKWENSVTMPDIMLLPIIADTFEVTIDYLFDKEQHVAQNINADNALNHFCNVFKREIVSVGSDHFQSTYNTKSFDEQLKEYESALKANNQTRSVIIRDHGVIYYRDEIGGLILKKPNEGWASLLENEDATKIIALLNNKDFCKVLACIIKTNMNSFTLSSLRNICDIEITDEFKNALMTSGFFTLKTIRIDDRNVEIYDFRYTHRLFALFAVLTYAKEFSKYEDICYYFFGDADFPSK